MKTSIKTKQQQKISTKLNSNQLTYITVLKALQDIPFGLGKKLLIEFLKGKETAQIKRTNLHFKQSFGILKNETINNLNATIDSLILNKLCDLKGINNNQFIKVITINSKGEKEINNPTLYKKKLGTNFKEQTTTISDAEHKLFDVFSDFLSIYNDEQKKAIISNYSNILCLAGAGSGKTTVLIKRIEFMVQYRSVNPSKILAITFTRKARLEMQERLSKISETGINLRGVKVETFNSFCEKILQRYNDLIYERKVRVLSYRDRFIIMNKALSKLKITMGSAIDGYFSFAQKRGKTPEQLSNIFMNDCFFVRDYFKFKNKKIEKESFEIDTIDHEKSVDLVLNISKEIEKYMQTEGLRDYADQLIDTIKFFKSDIGSKMIPEFEHILVDEYQDVNSTQIELIDILNAPNIFCVGDPRQSIYGWRGSDIRYILQFDKKYPKCETITLTKNYRSIEHIVELSNKSIARMGLPNLKSGLKSDTSSDEDININEKVKSNSIQTPKVNLLGFKNEKTEFDFIVKQISKSNLDLKEIFILGRTNKQLNEISKLLVKSKIRHILRNDDGNGGKGNKYGISESNGAFDGVTLATVHAIKGLEAQQVFVIGCNAVNFPCKGSEHPVIDIVKVEEYDKEEEERRLFYVAISRAKDVLYMTYSGKNPTYFITSEMTQMIQEIGCDKISQINKLNKINDKNNPQKEYSNEFLSGDTIIQKDSLSSDIDNIKLDETSKKELENKLKEWRYNLSIQANKPPYVIMNNKTLLEIVDKIPSNFDELSEINGIGPAKINQYGRDILEILSNCNNKVIEKMDKKKELKEQVKIQNDNISDDELLNKYYKIKIMLNKVVAREKELKDKIKTMMNEKNLKDIDNNLMILKYKTVDRVSYPKAKIEKFIDNETLNKIREHKEIEILSVNIKEQF